VNRLIFISKQTKSRFRFVLATEIDMDLENNLYIVDSTNHRVVKWTLFGSTGVLVAGGNLSGNASNQLYEPQGMYLEKDSLTIWIADTGNHRIVKWISPTDSSIVCGSEGSANDQFDTPTGIFIDENNGNTMYIADCYNHRIQRWIEGAVSGTTVAGVTGVDGTDFDHLSFPNKVLVDEDENMFILDSGNDRVLRWKIGETSGEVIAGGQGSGIDENQLFLPQSIRFGINGSLYVADTYNNRIQKFDPLPCRKLILIHILFISIKHCFSYNNNINNNNNNNNNNFKWINQYWFNFHCSKYFLNSFILSIN